MKHSFKFNVGDYSNDGHGQNVVIFIKSTKPVDEVIKAFKTSGANLNLIKRSEFVIAQEYQDSKLSNEHAAILESAGIEFEDLVYNEADEDEEPEYSIHGKESIVHLVMRIAQKELDFQYEISNDSIPSFNGFGGSGPQIGYGLFF